MATGALIEHHRLTSSDHGVTLTVFLLMAQLLVGAGEAFKYMGQLDFFLCECPKGMKTMSTGLFLSTCALSFLLQHCHSYYCAQGH
jgi:peptide/histidine transporter 3/4